MSNEMIERVAKAIGKADIEIMTSGSVLNYKRILAKAAIAAMREPTDQQRNEYFKLAKAEGHSDHNACFQDAFWNRAIDAALKED